jgi:hypothetical protein
VPAGSTVAVAPEPAKKKKAKAKSSNSPFFFRNTTTALVPRKRF